ncbi:MAG: chromate transporter [Syntrophobacteraceae bacterium]
MNIFYELAVSFLKIGFFGFGGGFAMIPLMQSAVVYQTGWLSASQFGAAIALGQVTPGPVAISATFIGYKVAGIAGAVVATAAIFTPSLICMYLLEKFYLKVRGKEMTQAIMHGVLPVVAAIILTAAISLGKESMHSLWQSALIVAVAGLAISRRVSYGLLVAGSMAVGIVMAFVLR